MGIYLNHAAAVITNSSSESFIFNICTNHKKIHCFQRYIPNPEVFKPIENYDTKNKKFDIFFVGKINYHWRYKGLDLLLKIIKKNNLKSLFIIGGKYQKDIEKLVTEYDIQGNVHIIDFIHPEQMPAMYHSCRFVWCWEEQGGIDDFSNIIWESLFCNTHCIVNSVTSEKMKFEGIPGSFESLIHELDNSTLFGFDFNHSDSELDLTIEKKTLYNKYIDRNLALYKNII